MGFWKEMFSENGIASSKRVLGGFCLIIVVLVWGKETIMSGLGEHEKDLAEVIIATAGVLLGITSFANIFSRNNNKKEEE